MTTVNNLASLKIVIIEPLYDTWDNMLARDLFGQIVDVKLKGFGAQYPYGVMPIDTNDFISTHHLICQESETGLKVLSAFKTVDLDRSLLHNTTFPPLALVNLAGTPTHVRAVENVMANSLHQGKKLIYSGSYTMDPAVRKDKKLLTMLRETFNSMYISYTKDYGIDEVLVGATMRFKMHSLFNKMGYENLKINDDDVAPINVEHLSREKVQLMHLKELSEEAASMAKPYKYLWEQRMVIGAETKEKEVKEDKKYAA